MGIDKKRGKPGRPVHDVYDFVFAWISHGLADGKTVTQAALSGLTVFANADDAKPVRRLKGKHLEAAFRATEHDRVVPWLRETPGITHAWPIFMGRPLPMPFGAATPSERTPGRPKKNRASRF